MKKAALVFTVFSALNLSAQKKKSDILKSTNIKEIENFLRVAHPDDPRRSVLKPKLISLRNSTWMKAGKTSFASLKPVVTEIPRSVAQQKDNAETEEFRKLLDENSGNHQKKTVKLLNQLFNNDVSNKEAILLLQNNSDCNMIVRIQGEDYYNLAVPAHGENSVVIKKGDYQLNSNVCDVRYSSTKNIAKNMLVILNNPVIQLQTYAQRRSGASN